MARVRNLNLNYPDWISTDKNEVHGAIVAQVHDYDKNSNSLQTQNVVSSLKQYLGRGVPSLYTNYSTSDMDINGQLGISPDVMGLSFNITAAVIDTLTAKLASLDIIPKAVTFKGNAKGRRLADDINYLISGLFSKLNLSHQLNLAYRDAMINRSGYLKVITEDGDVRIDRIVADEIIIDVADGYYNQPYKMIHRKAIPVHVAIEKWPKFRNQILECSIHEARQYNTQNFTPCVDIIEGWCRNSYIPKGRHVIAIETATLLDENWDKDYFPILRVQYNEPVLGHMGQSVVDELFPIQREIDRILLTMQSIMKIISVPRIFIDSNTQVNPNHITNDIGAIINYDGHGGAAPVIHNGAGMPPELPAQVEFLIAQGYARVGLTAMDTQGQKPGGLISGEALREVNDQKSERMQLLEKNYEHSHIELSNLILKELKGQSLKLTAIDKDIGLVELSSDVIPDTENSYVLKIFPASSLSRDLPGKIEDVNSLIQMGVISPSYAPELFSMPDIDSFTTLQSAPRKLMEKKIEDMLESGKYYNPEPYHDLDFALSHALQQYSLCQIHDEEETKLELLRSFIDDVRNLLSQRIQAPSPTQPNPASGVNNAGPSRPGTGQ